LGRPLQAAKLKITPLSFAPSPIFPSILPTVALSQRPDIRAAESRLRSSLFLEKSSQLNLFPSLGLKLSGISMSSSLSNPWKSWEAQAGPFVDIPIWSPRRKHQVRVSKVKVELMEAEWKALIIRAVEEVERSTIAFSTISEQLELAKDMVNQANALLAVTREKLESGIVSQLELLEDERRLFRAERKALTIKLEEYEAALDLSKSLGLCMIKSN
jgi:outer membrane protein TolC